MNKKIYIHKHLPTLAGYKEILSRRKWKDICYVIIRVKMERSKRFRNGWMYYIATEKGGKIREPYPFKILVSERDAIKESKKFIESGRLK